MGVCLSKGHTKEHDNITIQPTPRRVGAIFPAKQSRLKVESTSADVGARLEARKPPKVDEPLPEKVPNNAGEPEKGDSQEALQASRLPQDVPANPNGMLGGAAEVCPDPGTVDADMAAIDPGSVEHKHPNIPVDFTAAPAVLAPDSEGAATRDFVAPAESDSAVNDSTSGQNLVTGEAADKELGPEQLPLKRLPELAALGLQLHANSPQASERASTEGSMSAQDSDADDEVTGMLRQDSYRSEQRGREGLADDSNFTESLILSAPQHSSSGRSTPGAELYDCITATHDAPLDVMWAQAFKLGDVITVDGSTPGEVQEAEMIFEDAQQPIASPVALPFDNESGRGEGLDISGKESAHLPGTEGESPALLELPSADHAGQTATSASHRPLDDVSSCHVIPEEKQDAGRALVLKLEDVQPSGLFWSFTPGVDIKPPPPLTSSNIAAIPNALLPAGGGARADLDEVNQPVGAIDNVRQVLDIPTQKIMVRHNLDEGGDVKKANSMGVPRNEEISLDQGLDGWTIGARHAGGLEAAKVIVAPVYTASGAATPIHSVKPGDSGTPEAAAESGNKLKDLLAINPFRDETPAEQGPHEWAPGTTPNETLEAPHLSVASAIVSSGAASHAHRTEPGEYLNGSPSGAARLDAPANGSQCPDQTASPRLGVDLETADGLNSGSLGDAIPGPASGDKVLALSMGVPPTPIDGKVVGYERDQAACDVLADAGQVQGITGAGPLTNRGTDLKMSEKTYAYEPCEDSPGLNAEGAQPGHHHPDDEPMAPKVVQQDTIIASSQAAPVEARTLSEAAIDDALSATVTSVLWSSPDTIAEGEPEASDSQLLALAQPETAGDETSVDEPDVAVMAIGEHETQGGVPSPIKGMPVEFEAEPYRLAVSDGMAPLGAIPVSVPLARPSMADADEVETSDASTAPAEGSPPSPLKGIQVTYESAEARADVACEKAPVEGLINPVQAASPTMSEADKVESSNDSTAAVAGELDVPVPDVGPQSVVDADGCRSSDDMPAYLGSLTSANLAKVDADHVGELDETSFPVEGLIQKSQRSGTLCTIRLGSSQEAPELSFLSPSLAMKMAELDPNPARPEVRYPAKDTVPLGKDTYVLYRGFAGSGHMNDSLENTTAPILKPELAHFHDTAAEGSKMSQESGPTVGKVPSLNLSSIVQEMLGQDFAPTGNSGFHSARESGYESDSEGGLLTPQQPYTHAAQSHVDGEEVGGTDASQPPDGLQGVVVAGQDEEGSKMFGGAPEVADVNPDSRQSLAVMDDSDTQSGQMHQEGHPLDPSAGLADPFVRRSKHGGGLDGSVVDGLLTLTSAKEPVMDLTDNAPERSSISATSEPAVSDEFLAPLSSSAEDVLILEMESRAAPQTPVMSGYGSDSEGGMLTSAPPDQLAGRGEEKGEVSDVSADAAEAVASRSKDHVGISDSLQDPVPAIPGAEQPVIALTDNVPPSTDIYPSSDLTLGIAPPAALSSIVEGTPTQAADTDVVSGSPARSGYEPDSAEAELTTEVACSIPENLHVPVPAHEEAPAVKKPLVRSQEVVQSPGVSSLTKALDNDPAGKIISLPGDEEAAIAGSPAEGTPDDVSPIIIMQAAHFDDGRTGSLPLLIEADTAALRAPALSNRDAASEGMAPVGSIFSMQKGPHVLDDHTVPGLEGGPLRLDGSSAVEKDAATDMTMPEASAEAEMQDRLLQAPVTGEMFSNAPTLKAMEVDKDTEHSPQTASLTQSGPDALPTGVDAFSPGEDGSAGLLGSAFVGAEEDPVVAEVLSSRAPATSPDQWAAAGLQQPAEEDVEEHSEASGTGGLPDVSANLVDQAKATLAWMSIGVVDAVSAVANSASTLAAKDSPASPEVIPPVTAAEPGDAPVISGETSSMGSVRAAGMAIAEKFMDVAEAFQARVPGLGFGPGITEEDGLEGTLSSPEVHSRILGSDGQGSGKTYSNASGVGAGSHGMDSALSRDVDVASGSQVGDAGDASVRSAPQSPGVTLDPPATNVTSAGSNDQAAIANLVQGIFHRVTSDQLAGVHSQQGKTGTPELGSDVLVSPVLGQKQSAAPKMASHNVDAASGNHPVTTGIPAPTLVAPMLEEDVNAAPAPQASGVTLQVPATDAPSAGSDGSGLDGHDHAAIANLVQGIFHRVASDNLADVQSQQGKTGTPAHGPGLPASPVLQSAGPKASPFMATDKGVPGGVSPSTADTTETPTLNPVTPGLALPTKDHIELDHERGPEVEDRQQGPGIASRVLGLFGFGLRRSADANMDVRRSVTGRPSEAELPDMPLMQSASPRIIPTGARHKDRMPLTLSSMMSREFSDAASFGLSRMNSVDTTASYASGNDILKSHPVEFESDVDEA